MLGLKILYLSPRLLNDQKIVYKLIKLYFI